MVEDVDVRAARKEEALLSLWNRACYIHANGFDSREGGREYAELVEILHSHGWDAPHDLDSPELTREQMLEEMESTMEI